MLCWLCGSISIQFCSVTFPPRTIPHIYDRFDGQEELRGTHLCAALEGADLVADGGAAVSAHAGDV